MYMTVYTLWISDADILEHHNVLAHYDSYTMEICISYFTKKMTFGKPLETFDYQLLDYIGLWHCNVNNHDTKIFSADFKGS